MAQQANDWSKMSGPKRTALLATVVSLFGMAAAVPMIVSGTASAQEGSRLCGREYNSTGPTKPNERVYRIYEVPKTDILACIAASSSGGRTVFDSGFALVNTSWDGAGKEFEDKICEDFTAELRSLATISGKPGKIKDDGPTGYDQFDICNNMERSDTAFELKSYFLYLKQDQNEWLFKRK